MTPHDKIQIQGPAKKNKHYPHLATLPHTLDSTGVCTLLPIPLLVTTDADILLDVVGCFVVGPEFPDGALEGLRAGGDGGSLLPSKPQIPQKDLMQSVQTDALTQKHRLSIADLLRSAFMLSALTAC